MTRHRLFAGNAGAGGPIAAFLALLFLASTGTTQAQVVLDAKRHHLGIAGRPEWDEFAGDEPESRALKLSFEGRFNPREVTLLIRQHNVKLDWPVRLNGRPIGRLLPMEAALWHALPVPPGTIRDGANTLLIESPGQIDDVVIDQVALDARPVREALGRATLDVSVTDAGTGAPLPCRITITDPAGILAPLVVEPGSRLAARPGVVYTPDGRARIGLRPGKATVFGSRGFEYGVASRSLTLEEGQSHSLDLSIRREVSTPGLVACDTHVHTLTHSGHGDASIDERVVTLAGEGIELPVATDHDVFANLDPAARRQGVRSFFTPVAGDEVTTRTGHFNAFPFSIGGSVPDSGITDWPRLLRAIRSASAPAPAVVILNHPRDRHAGFRPFDPDQFNPVTGEHRRGPLGVDALEIVNSGALQSDPMRLVRDWMALLNHGERITAVAGSDSHDVARYIVGQGRTYIACPDHDPARIDIAAAVRALHEGRATVSLGLLTTLNVDGRFQVGDLATGGQPILRVTATVLGPSWSRADRVELFADGVKLREQQVEVAAGARAGTKTEVTWEIPRPGHDIYLVAIASGPGVAAPFWAVPHPYQPSSRTWTPRVLGVANPIYIDGDGDAVWTSPMQYAKRMIERVGTQAARLLPALESYDEAVAAQAAGLCQAAGRDVRGPEFARLLRTAAGPVQRGFAAFTAVL
ncbi:MAG: CehA/McbA family metallohydrolase [Isosphaerales bacterium]